MVMRPIVVSAAALLMAVPLHSQQQVRGQLPADSFVIDPARVAKWNDKSFTGADREFSVQRFDAVQLERWDHEFPVRHAAVSEAAEELETVEARTWEAPKQTRVDVERRAQTGEADLPSKSRRTDTLVINEKWARVARKDTAVKQEETSASEFIVQATIRPLEVQEVQEKLNEYSSPPGERQKQLPSQLQKSSKF